MRYLLVFISVIVFVCMPAVAGAGIRVVPKPPVRVGWLEIKGYGKDLQAANRDALRQIQQVFGMHRIVSVSVVRDGVLECDEVRQDTSPIERRG